MPEQPRAINVMLPSGIIMTLCGGGGMKTIVIITGGDRRGTLFDLAISLGTNEWLTRTPHSLVILWPEGIHFTLYSALVDKQLLSPDQCS